MESELARGVMRDAAMSGAGIIKEAAGQNVPRRTGFLSRNIVIKKGTITGESATVSIGWHNRAFYGKFSEYGTRNMRARPFMQPAADKQGDKAQNAALDTLRRKLWPGG